MTSVLELIEILSRAVWEPVWIPILVWTVFALPLWALLKNAIVIHPYAEYRLWQMLLATLPVGLFGVLVIDSWWTPYPIATGSGLSLLFVPPVEVSAGSGAATPEVTVTHGIGALTVAALVLGIIRVGKLIANARAVLSVRSMIQHRSPPEVTQPTVDRLLDRLGGTRPLSVFVVPQVDVPVTIGGLRPLVLLPPGLLDRPEAMRMALMHEFLHIRRYDDVAHVIERAVTAVFSFHPLVCRLQDRIAEARERACDAAVLADDETPTSTYARLLVNFADGGTSKGLGALTLSESPSSLTNRLNAMTSSLSRWLTSPFSLVVSLLTVGVLVTFGMVACSDSIAPEAPDQSAEPETSTKSEVPQEVYTVVEDRPDCGGVEGLSERIEYPDPAKESGIEGRVFVQFIVDKNGSVVEPTITKGVHETLNEAALAAVQELTCEPGKVSGTPVKVKMALPVTFQLPE